MNSLRCLGLLISILVLAGTAFGQSVYFDEDNGGFAACVSYITHDNLTGFAIGFGGSSGGVLDAGLSIGRFTGNHVTVLALGGSLTYYAVRSRPGRPLGFGFAAGFEHDNASGNASWSSYSAAGTTASIGTMVYVRMDDGTSSSLIPFVGVHYLAVIDGEADGTAVFDGGVTFAMRTSERKFFTITMQLGVTNEYVTAGLELGLAVRSRVYDR